VASKPKNMALCLMSEIFIIFFYWIELFKFFS